MTVIINPGTEEHELNMDNARTAAKYFLEDLALRDMQYKEMEIKGSSWLDFKFFKNDFELVVSFPSDDPAQTRKGKPFVSKRVYVDGSSWLWGFGLSQFIEHYKEYLLKKERIRED